MVREIISSPMGPRSDMAPVLRTTPQKTSCQHTPDVLAPAETPGPGAHGALGAQHGDLAARLRALAPQRLTNQQRKAIYCNLLRQVAEDPAVQAIIEQIVAGNTPSMEYYLGYSIVISPRGVETTLEPARLSADQAQRLADSIFAPETFLHRDFFGQRAKAEASIACCIEDICADLVSALSEEQAFGH